VSDVVCLFADVRFPLFHFPHAVYRYLKEIGKPCLVVLTKVDLVSYVCFHDVYFWFIHREQSTNDWIRYFKEKFQLPVVPVISRDSSKNHSVKQFETGV
jgi:ribosome biogenesis GTPase A